MFIFVAKSGTYMRKLLLLVALPMLLLACSSKKNPGEEQVDIKDMMAYFPESKIPFQLGDTVLEKSHRDESYVPARVFNSFIPDSVWTSLLGKTAKPRIYPLGKVTVKGNETYLFVRLTTPVKKAVYVLAMDKELKFVAGLPVLQTDPRAGAHQVAIMDSKYVITSLAQRKNAAGEQLYRKNVYVYNSLGVFTLILTESNDAESVTTTIINPVDTFPHKHKLSGDYVVNAKNFISIRDGRQASHLLFFIHFEKDNGTCKGELKGEMILLSPTTARYTQRGGPCVLEFAFNGKSVSMKETGGCGANRDIKCFFEGSFPKKKEVIPVKKKKNKTAPASK